MSKEKKTDKDGEVIKNKGGRPRTIEIDWKVLDTLMQFKVTKKFCAEYMNISEDTIDARLKSEFQLTFDQYRQERNQKMQLRLQSTAIEMALGKNTAMMIFCLKNLCGWSDKPHEIEELQSGLINIQDYINDLHKRRSKNDHSI